MKNPNQHNYLKHLFEMHAQGHLKEGTVTTVAVAHDDWCHIFKGGKCNCNPTLTTNATRSNRATRRRKGGKQ